MTPVRPEDLGGEVWRTYVRDLRETWPDDPELARKYGVPAVKRHSETPTMQTETSDSDAQFTNPSRRTFMRGVGVAAATAVVGTGSAAAEHSGLSYSSGIIPDPWIEGTVSIGTHDRGEMSSVLEYIPDDGDDATDAVSLAEVGGRVAPREDETTVHNPITLRADKIETEEYTKFPRGETYDDDNDTSTDEVDLDAIDATHWTVDESATAGTMTVEDAEAPSGGSALRVYTSSQVSGDVATARFTDFEITNNELAKYLQLGVTVDALPSGSVVTIRAEDSTGATVDTVIDPSEDGSLDHVIATTTVTGRIFQVELGQLASSLDDLVALEIEVADENPDVTLFGLNLERSSRWVFGSQEFLNSDSEVETQTVYEPTSSFSITGLETIADVFSSARIHDLDVAARFDTSSVDSSEKMAFDFEDIDHPSYDRQFNYVVNRELPTAYELGYSGLVMNDETVVWDEQYQTLDIATGESEYAGLDDVADLDTVDRSNKPGDRGDEFELSSAFGAGEVVVSYYELRINSEDESTMKASGASGPGGASGGGGFFSSARGMMFGLAGGVATFFALFRSRIFG